MKKFSVTERDIDRLLSGRNPADGSEDRLAAFIGSARRVLSVPPDETTEAAHLTAILAATRHRPSATILPATGKRGSVSSLGLRLRAAAAKVAIGALGLTTGTAGLAMAGMDLPGTVAEKAFQAVGITLPNQGQDHIGSPNASDTSRRVREAHQGRDNSMSGCEFGASVSRAARGVANEGDPEHCNRSNKDNAGADKNDRAADKDAREADREADKDAREADKDAREADKDAREADREADKDAREADKDAREADREAAKDAREAAKDAREADREAAKDAKKDQPVDKPDKADRGGAPSADD